MKIEANKKRATAGWPLRNRVPQYAGVNVLDRDRIFRPAEINSQWQREIGIIIFESVFIWV